MLIQPLHHLTQPQLVWLISHHMVSTSDIIFSKPQWCRGLEWQSNELIRPLGYERVYMPLYKGADTPFHFQGDSIYCPLEYERVYLPLYKGADTPFHFQGDSIYCPLEYERVYLPPDKVADTPFHIQGDSIHCILTVWASSSYIFTIFWIKFID